MKAFPWLSATYRRLSRRERLVIAAGGGVSLLALLAVLVVLPQARRWLDREEQIAMRGEQLARLEALISREDAVRQRLAEVQQARASAGRLLLAGETAAVAGSSLQLLLNRYAQESRVVLDRVDAVRPSGTEAGILEVPARIAVRGDVYGLVDLLFYLQNGEKLLVIDDLRVSEGRGDRRRQQLLTMSVSLHGYYRTQEGEL
jgi:type II secretory pathway component PulM